jgi:hypothetical protein
MSSSGTEGFDRLRRRDTGRSAPAQAPTARLTDPQGRRALYSTATQEAPAGAVTVSCSRCGETSVATPRQAALLALPSLHLPLLRRTHPSWMRCPACRTRTWVRVGLRL